MSGHIKMYFDEDEVLHVYPSDTVGVMALRHFQSKLQTYGVKMLELHVEIPLHDPFKGEVK